MRKKFAATVLIIKDGKVLAVSRKDNHKDFGLPGGKLDKGESFLEAAIRELKEETGLIAHKVRHVFTHDDGYGYIVATFIAEEYSGELRVLSKKETGKIEWVIPQVLLDGCFSDYNRKLFSNIGFA